MQQGLLITRLTDTSGQPPDPRSHQQAVDNLLSTGLLLPDKDFRKGTVYRLFGKNNPAATEVAWMTPTNEVDIERWVDDAPTHQRGFREAVHIILDSIGHSRNLQARMACQSKGLTPTARSMEDEAVQQLAREGYADLRSDVDGELPAFEDAFGAVSSLYGRLPW